MAGGFWQRFWLGRLSSPAAERIIHRHVLRERPRRILEVGLGRLVRTERILAALLAADPVRYVGVDRFEGRGADDPPGVSLKEAHRRLHAMGRVQLVPGNADAALARVASQLGTFDLVLVSADNDPRHLEQCWPLLPRLLTATASVFREESARRRTRWVRLSPEDLDRLAGPGRQRIGLRHAG